MIRGKAPLRVSLCGGGTDLDYVFKEFGGAVVSTTIDKYCHMSLNKREDDLITVNGKPLDGELLTRKVVDEFNPSFGFDLTYYNDIAPGSGLGSSSSFVILLLRLLHETAGNIVTDHDLVKQAYKIETSIKEGGWQDQYATAIGGFNFMEFGENTLIYPLRLKYSFLCELNEHLLLCKVDGKKEGDTHKELREYSESNQEEFKRTAKIKHLAFSMRDCLLNQDIGRIGNILDANWELKRNEFITNDHIDGLYNLAKENGAEGGKLCGSGQGGHMLFFVKPENRNQLIQALGDRVVNFNLSVQGVETW